MEKPEECFPIQTRSIINDVLSKKDSTVLCFPLCQRMSIIEEDPSKRLLDLIDQSLSEIEESDFFSKFMYQIQTPDFQNSFLKATIGKTDDLKIPMVIYGIGSIEKYKNSQLQLALALLMKRRFVWIGEIEVYDPVVNEIESRVMTILGCSVLSINEKCRREAIKPTLFFMPHCDTILYNNLLEANWTEEKLKNIILLGNDFKGYEDLLKFYKLIRFDMDNDIVDSGSHIMFAKNFCKEFNVQTPYRKKDLYCAFSDLSWQFYNVIDYAKTEQRLVSTKYAQWPSKN